MDKIILKGMAFYAFHGVSEAERKVGHRFEVDVELGLDTRKAGQSDDINDTVNYQEVYRGIEEIISSRSFLLLEALAEELAGRVLSNQLVETVVLRVKKLRPPIAGIVGSAAVEISRGRNLPTGSAARYRAEAKEDKGSPQSAADGVLGRDSG
jgi:7,8-dihydroneopterin aldolase/epimerase/oxygenase